MINVSRVHSHRNIAFATHFSPGHLECRPCSAAAGPPRAKHTRHFRPATGLILILFTTGKPLVVAAASWCLGAMVARVQLLLLTALSLSLQLASCKRQQQDSYAYVAFVNDVHNRLEEEDPTTSTPCSPSSRQKGICVGGWARISSAVKSLRLQARKEGAAFFFLDAGDEFTGTMWDVVYQGQTVAPRILNMVAPDAMVRARGGRGGGVCAQTRGGQ